MFSYQSTLKPGEPALTTELIGRRIAYPFALLAKKLGMSANTITVIAGSCWMISLPLPILAGVAYVTDYPTPSMTLWFAAGFLWNAGYILDMADGSLARMTGTSSKRGFYLDYVFHLLFKPLFLFSIGIGCLYMSAGNQFPWWLPILPILAIFSIPANWSLTQSAVQHVLCETTGRNRDKMAGTSLNDGDFRKLWLGTNEINDSAAEKRSAPFRFIKNCVQEIFSYYGQFTFFSITVLIDIVIWLLFPVKEKPYLSYPPFIEGNQFLVTTFFFVLVSSILIIRLPFRVYREYKRIALADEDSATTKGKDAK